MAAIAFSVAFAVVAIGLGWPVVAALDRRGRLSPMEKLAIAPLVGGFAVYFGVFFVGLWRLDVVTMGVVAALLVVASVPGLRTAPWGVALTGLRTLLAGRSWAALWMATAAAVGVLSVLQGLAPPNDYDSMVYHLSMPRYDVENGVISIPWDRQLIHALFPAYGGNISRIALVLANDYAAQIIHGLFGLVAALGSGLLVRRLGYGAAVAAGAAAMFLCIRAVIWEMGTAETDIVFAAFVTLAVLAYLAFRQHHESGLAVIFGLMIGGAILVKLHGFVFAAAMAPLMVFDLAVRTGRTAKLDWRYAIGPLVALAVVLPHLVRVYVLTGNPVFPLFNSVLNPGKPEFLSDLSQSYGVGRDSLHLLSGPWNFSILPTYYFDGMVLGAPYLLAFCPLVLLDATWRRWLPVLSVATVFYVFWFYLLSQQVRFLVQLAPLMTPLAAVGVGALWERTQGRIALRGVFAAITVVFSLNQAMFVAAYAGIRLPPALGLIDAATFHAKTPTMNSANYETCSYIARNLKPGERYYSNARTFLSYYCPQAPAVRNHFADEAKWWLQATTLPPMTLAEFVERVEAANFRFFMTSHAVESRRNVSRRSEVSEPTADSTRFGPFLAPVFEQLEPLSKDSFTAVYDGPSVTRLLRESLAANDR